jgi:DNA primase
VLDTQTNLLDLIGNDTQMRRVAATQGGEYAGPCPFCGGTDRFRVWPEHSSGQGRFWCRQCAAKGDAIDYLCTRDRIGFNEACQRLRIPLDLPSKEPPRGTSPASHLHHRRLLRPPSAQWQTSARAFVETCQEALWTSAGRRGLDWLHARKMDNSTIKAAGLGFNVTTRRPARSAWGLPPDEGKQVWLPSGIVIPWQIDGQLWRVNIRRLKGEPRYIGPAGSANGLYGVDGLFTGTDRPVVLVEGEFDALSLQQEAGEAVAVVAAGSTAGARRPRWIALLAQAPVVLVGFDADEAGDEGAHYWLRILANAHRWRPYWEDVNAMMQDGVDVRDWLEAGLKTVSSLDNQTRTNQCSEE